MAIMKWNTPPSEDRGSNSAHVVGHGEGVALQHAAFGAKVEGGAQVNTLEPNIELATKWSTAPYTGPEVDETETTEPPNPWGYRSAKRQGKCLGNEDTCKARMVARWDPYCNAHGRMNAGLSPFDSSQDHIEKAE